MRCGAAPQRRHAHHALADRDLRSHPFGVVAVAGDRVQPVALLIDQEQQRVSVAEQLSQAIDGHADQGVEISTPVQSRTQLAQAGRGRRVGPGRTPSRGLLGHRRAVRQRPLDANHPVDVSPPKVKYVLHAVQRGDSIHVVAQVLERGTPPLGPLVHDRHPVLVVRARVDHEQARPRVLGKVAGRLREELVRQGDAFAVYKPHP